MLQKSQLLKNEQSSPNKKKGQEKQEQEKSSLEQLITDPLHLKLLILAGTDLKIAELQQINTCVNLMKLDISSNHLSSLPASVDFGKFVNLRLLYLHNNSLSDMESLNQIFKCKQVIYLTLFRNPLSELNSIRHYIINSMPNLKCLDFNYIMDEERSDILMADDNQSARYYQLSKLSWPVVIYPNDENLTEQQYLNILYKEISIITTQHRKCSFILTIQRFIRGFIIRRRVYKLLTQIHQKENSIIKYARKWKQFIQRKKELKEVLVTRKKQYLLEDGKMYRHARAMSMLAQLVREFKIKLQQKKRKERAARILLRSMNSKKAYFHAYDDYLNLQSNINGECQPIQVYFRQDQIKLIDNEEFLKFMVLFASDSAVFKPLVEDFCNNLQNNIIKSNPFQILRIPDSDSIVLPGNPLIQLIKPSLNCKVIQRRKQGVSEDIGDYDKYYSMNRHPVLMKYQRIVYIKEKFLQNRYQMSQEERQKSQILVNKLVYFQEKNDSMLFEIKFPHNKVLSYFLRTVIYMNQDIESYIDDFNNGGSARQEETDSKPKKFSKKEKLLIFFSPQLQRISSAIKIQQVWRQYVIKKILKKASINPYQKLLEHHASSKLQRWIKKVSYSHKSNFMKDIYHHLTNVIKTKQLFIHEQVYLKLLAYQNTRQYNNFQTQKDSLFSFRQQNSTIYFNKRSNQIIVRNIEPEFIKSVFPQYIQKIFVEQGIDDQFDTSFMQGDIFHILHVGCKITRHEIGPMNYIQIDFPSLSQALYRTAVLGNIFLSLIECIQQIFYNQALKTYTFRQNGTYVKLQPYHHILDCNIILPYEEKLQLAYRIQIEEIEGRDKHQIKKEIDNKESMFICSDFQKQFIMQGIDTTMNFGYKQIHMFTPSVNNKPPQKIVNNLIYFLSDNIYMNLNSQKEDNSGSLNINRFGSIQHSRKTSGNYLSERNSAFMLGQSGVQKNDRSQIASPNENDHYQAESNLQNYSQNLFISQYYLEEGQINESGGIFTSVKKNDSTAAQSRNSSIPYVSQSNQRSIISQRDSQRRSLSSLVPTNNLVKQIDKKAVLRQQDLQFQGGENDTENPNGTNLNHEELYGIINHRLTRKIHSSSTKNNNNLNGSRGVEDSLSKINEAKYQGGGGAIHSSLLQNDMIRSKVVKPGFRDSKEINKFIKDRENDSIENKRMRIIQHKDRSEELKDMNQQLQQIKVLEKATIIRKQKYINEQIRTGDMIIQQQSAIQQAQNVRNHSAYGNANDFSKIENQLIQNTNFLSKQISSFQSKRNKYEIQQSNQLKAQSIKNQKLLNFIPKGESQLNKSVNHSRNGGGILNQSSFIEGESQFQQYQSIINSQQHSGDSHLHEQLNFQKRSQSICDKSLNNNSQIIISSAKNELNNSGLFDKDDLSRKQSLSKRLPSLEKTKQVLSNYLQNNSGYNPQASILPQLNVNESSPSKIKNESIITNVKLRQYQGSQAKKRIQSSNQKDRIIHSVFPEEFYPIANGQSENQFLFDFNIETNNKKLQNKPYLQSTSKK